MRGWAFLIAPLALICTAAAVPFARGLIFSGLPPERFQSDKVVEVQFVRDLNKVCGQPPKNGRWLGCVRGPVWRPVIAMPNPCYQEGDYAKILCHELGHRNGWTAYHEY